ncbi:hypothetical protein PILCRDRAFT_602449 [Piloderma croceum F 1598]|uniref:CFEM domain-containing protein n=1 Tax=Piloderma croceum (strain F 1598) TaxID=765440 RepID=A0A0C3FDR9_PILCF|nr:hypothetical protein PILCRDRAFT_602449 [Piloderma croceum F 1598]
MEMRLVFTIIAFSGVFTVVANAFIGTRQACAVNCLVKANLGGCTFDDYVCLCKSQPYIQSMASCVNATCDSADTATRSADFQSLCNSLVRTVVPLLRSTRQALTPADRAYRW